MKVGAQALALLVFLYFLNAFVQTDYFSLRTIRELSVGIVWLLLCYTLSRAFGIVTILALSTSASILWGLFIQSVPTSDFLNIQNAAARLSAGEFALLLSVKSPTTISYYAAFHLLPGPAYVINYIASSAPWTGGVALTYMALRSFFHDERKVKFVCAALAFCPAFVVFSPVVSSESVFFLLSALCAWLISRHLVGSGPFPYLYIAMGVSAAGLFFTRPDGLLALVVCVFSVGLGRARYPTDTEQEDSESKTRSFRHPLVLCAIVLVVFTVVWFAHGYLSWANGKGFQVTSTKQGPIYLLFGTNMDSKGRFNSADVELARYRGENRLPVAQANERGMRIAIERITSDVVGFGIFSLTDKVEELWGREELLYAWALGDKERADRIFRLKADGSNISLGNIAEIFTNSNQPLNERVWPLVFIGLDVYRITLLLFVFMLIREIRRPSNCLALGVVAFLLSMPYILIEVQARYHLAMTPFIVVGSTLFAYDVWSRRSEWYAIVRRQKRRWMQNRTA